MNRINDANKIPKSIPKSRRIFRVEKVNKGGRRNLNENLFADKHLGVLAEEISTNNNHDSNANHERLNNPYTTRDNNYDQNFTHVNENDITQNKYICHFPDCFREYKSKYNLRNHIKAHEGAIQHACLYPGCNKSYKIKENLDLHYKNYHLKEKPFMCRFCQKKFSHRNGKLYHEKKKHLNILPFRCRYEECHAAYASTSALKYHLSHKHKDVEENLKGKVL